MIAVSDFSVESRNPSYEFLGKGISRLVANELQKSGKVQLVEREQFNKLLAEQELSLSDLMDAKNQVRIGTILSAKYLVVGEIIDMGNSGVLVSVRMLKVDTGEIVWQDGKQEKLSVYDYMGAFFAKSLLDKLGVSAGQTTIAKIEKKEEKKEEAIIKTSAGIDAYDRKDNEAAKKNLEDAKVIDPTNDVVAEYLAKLLVNQTKLNIITAVFYNDQNPAYLGMIETDKLSFGFSGPLGVFFSMAGITMDYFTSIYIPNQDTTLNEIGGAMKLGYAFPVSKDLGMEIDLLFSAVKNTIYRGTKIYIWGDPPVQASTADIYNLGGIISLGYNLNEAICIGIGVSLYGATRSLFGTIDAIYLFNYGGSFGLLYRNFDETFIFDTRIGYSNSTQELINIDTYKKSGTVNIPLFNENTLTFALNQKQTFIILKQINEIAFDRPFYYGTILPAVEHFLSDWFSLRGGAEGSFALLNDKPNLGFGLFAGTTFRIITWGMDIDLNFAYRFRPARSVEGQLYPDFTFLINLSWSDLFVSRGK